MNVIQAHLVSLLTCRVIAFKQREVAIMAMNRIQFKTVLSMPDFLEAYGTELQCEQTLAAVRWPGRVSLSSMPRGQSLRFP